MRDLNDAPAFRALSPDGKALLAKGARLHRVEAGRTVVEKGALVSGAFFVLAGRLRVFALAPSGKEATLYLLEPGDTCVLALNSLFNRLSYPAWVESETTTTYAVVGGDVYRALFNTEPSIRELTVSTLSGVVFRLMAELEEVHTLTVEARLANFILTRSRNDGRLDKTQQELADHIGTSREVVARLTAKWAADGALKTGRGKITVLDRPALLRLAGQSARISTAEGQEYRSTPTHCPSV